MISMICNIKMSFVSCCIRICLYWDLEMIEIMVYRDEFPLQWEEFVAAPIKHLVRLFPILARCDTAGCKCEAWHNTENLPIRDPILDVWRRQYLKSGFKTAPPLKADFFRYASVCHLP